MARPGGARCLIVLKPPGFSSDLIVRADVAVLYRVWAGLIDYHAAVRRGEVVLEGPQALVRAFPRWFMWSPLVDVARAFRSVGAEGAVSRPS